MLFIVINGKFKIKVSFISLFDYIVSKRHCLMRDIFINQMEFSISYELLILLMVFTVHLKLFSDVKSKKL